MMDYLYLTQQIVEQASQQGYEAEAYLNIGTETNIVVDRGEVEKLSYAGSKGVGVRLFRDGKMGYGYTSDFSDQSIKKVIAEAAALADVADADKYRTLPDPQPIFEEELEIYDPAIGALAVETKVAMAKEIETAALAADPRVKMTNRTTYLDGVSQIYLANSRGFANAYKKSFVAGYLMAMAFDEEDRTTAFGIGFSSVLDEFEPGKIGTEAGKKAARLLGGKPVPTQEATVVYSPLAASSILGALSQALTAESMQKNRSFLHGKMGQDVAADVLTILDNGRLPGGLGTRPFDDEGVPTRATRLINEGVLQAVLQDHYTAQKDGGSSTGNASRSSHRQSPSLAASNFYIQPGPDSPETVIGQVEQGLYVVNVMNTASVNPISGDYSVSAQGFWIENGELTYPVNGVTIALPLDQLLKNVQAVANDLLFTPLMGAIGSPTIRIDGVMVGGV